MRRVGTLDLVRMVTLVVTMTGGAPALSGAMKSLCIPLESSGYQFPMPEGTKCFFTGEPAKR